MIDYLHSEAVKKYVAEHSIEFTDKEKAYLIAISFNNADDILAAYRKQQG